VPAYSQSLAQFVALGRLGVVVHKPDGGPPPHIAVIYENGDSEFNASCTELAKRGFMTLCVIEHGDSGFGAVGWERVALDVKAAIEYAHLQPGITKVVLFGHSGGGAVASFYEAVAENGIAFCQDAKKLSSCMDDLANLPRADAVLFPDAHPGLGVMSLRMINPSLSSDGVKLQVNPALDPFSKANGFNPDGPSHYSPTFQATYAKAQATIMTTLIAQALDIRSRLRSGALNDATADKIVIQQFGFANHLDELDPTAVGLMSTQQPRRLLRNDGSIVTQVIASVSVGNPAEAPNLAVPSASIQTAAQFLGRGAVRARNSIDDIDYCTANSVTLCNVAYIRAPVLFIASGANTFIADEERMYERSPSLDKEYIVVEGALHGGKPCTRCEKTPGQYGNSETNLYDYIRDWINKRM
jgi:alpha-beta hydrolase superfamily lysophospholipase